MPQQLSSQLNISSRLVKTLTFLAYCLSFGACTTTDKPVQTNVIKNAPAVDVSYQEVVDRLDDHVGVKVRWGGQIIHNESVENLTRLTIVAYPLSTTGRPDRNANEDFKAGRFIAEIHDFKGDEACHFITVYGQISGEEIWRTNRQVKSIPVLTTIKSKEWNNADRKCLG